MPLLDRFRARPAWQHPDPEARAAAVRHLETGEAELLASIARTDADARVRRAAVRRLLDPSLLSELASDGAPEVREEAGNALLELALHAEDAGIATAAAAGIQEPRYLVQVARAARVAGVRQAAVARLTDPRSLAAVAKGAEDPATRLMALAAIHDPASLLEVALKSDHKDAAVEAAGRIETTEALRSVALRARNKAAARRAREALAALAPPASPDVPESEPEAASDPTPDEIAAAEAAALAARRDRLIERVTALEGENALTGLDVARAEWEGLPPPRDDEQEHVHRFEEACAACRTRHQEWAFRQARRARLQELCGEAQDAAETAEVGEAKERLQALRAEWGELLASGPLEPDLEARFELSRQRVAEREALLREEDLHRRHENQQRLAALCERLEALVARADLTRKDAETGLRESKAALDDPGALPGRKERDDLLGRLRAARAALFPRAQELREADEWTRWANVAQQEELIAKTEALRGLADLRDVARQLREIEERWQAVRQVPREQAEALWTRFKGVRDEARHRVKDHFKKKSAEEAENLKRKLALIERAEALQESTDWLKTAQELQQLQAEWKTVGAVSHKKSQAVWERFRKACDRFFERRKQDLDKRKDEWTQNLTRKEALIAQAEALASSTEWEKAAVEIKKLQTEWKAIGPVRKSKSEQVWQRFRKACDAFFERYKHRHDIERSAQIQARAALVEELEGLAGGSDAGPDLAARVQALLQRWRQAPPAPPASEQPLAERLAAARNRIVLAHPDAFRGSDLDPGANRNRREKLLAKVEALAPTTAPAADMASLAERLREALATNTIAGRGEAEARRRAAIAEVDGAQAAWKRLGPVPGDEGDALERRFQEACQRFFAQNPRPSR